MSFVSRDALPPDPFAGDPHDPALSLDRPEPVEPWLVMEHIPSRSLQQLLDEGQMRPHEPAFDPDPANYVTWEYCRGYADAVLSDS